ncbi:MAG: mechanosensitive ion channel family protein [Gammaproteobacteria bacterium]|nr:mechanosensitive ion channel family protein [Gammaproteobacteria bacterium]MCH9743906.1 mechanosensitive ion channel family protein [Gammaproteobacteria bacterium]
MSEFLQNLNNFSIENFWLVKAVSVLVLAFAFSWIVSIIHKYLQPRFSKSKQIWDDVLLDALQKPLFYAIWGLAFIIVLSILAQHINLSANLKYTLLYLKKLVIIIGVFWFIMRYIRMLQHAFERHIDQSIYEYSKTSVNAFSQLARIVFIVCFIAVLIQTLGIKVSNFVAFGSVATTLILGVAAKDSLANFFGGMVIYCDRPFEIGDWIRIPKAEIEGTVEYIGWRMTRILTFDKRPLYVPNSTFMVESVENPSRMTNRRIKTLIGVRYDDATKMRTILKDVKAMIMEHPEIETKHTILVNFTNFGESSLDILIYCFTKTTNWSDYLCVQEDVYLRIIDIIEGHGADCAFPTRTLHVPGGLAIQQLAEGSNHESSRGLNSE